MRRLLQATFIALAALAPEAAAQNRTLDRERVTTTTSRAVGDSAVAIATEIAVSETDLRDLKTYVDATAGTARTDALGSITVNPGRIRDAADLDGTYQSIVTLTDNEVSVLRGAGVNFLEVWFGSEAIHEVSPWTPANTTRIDAVVDAREETQIGSIGTVLPVRAVYRINQGGGQAFYAEGIGALRVGGFDVTSANTVRIMAEAVTRDGGDQLASRDVSSATFLAAQIRAHDGSNTSSLFNVTAAFTTSARAYVVGQRYYLARHHDAEAEMVLLSEAGDGGGGPTGIPNAPANTASIARYELLVPATTGAATWATATTSGGTPGVDQTARDAAAAAQTAAATAQTTADSKALVGDRILQVGSTADNGDSLRASREDHVHNLALLSGGGLEFDAQQRLHVTGTAVSRFSAAQQIALLTVTPTPPGITYTSPDTLAAAVRTIGLQIPNPELVTATVWVEGYTQGQRGLTRTQWTSSTSVFNVTLTAQIARSVADSLISGGDDQTTVDLRFYDAASAGNEIERLSVNIPLVDLRGVPDGLPDAPAHTTSPAQYSLNIPANSGDATWTVATSGSGVAAQPDEQIGGALDIGAATTWSTYTITEDIERERYYRWTLRVGATNRFMMSSAWKGAEFLDLTTTTGTTFNQASGANLLSVTAPRPDVDGVRTFFMARPTTAQRILLRVADDYNVVRLVKMGGIPGPQGPQGPAGADGSSGGVGTWRDLGAHRVDAGQSLNGWVIRPSDQDFVIELSDTTGVSLMTFSLAKPQLTTTARNFMQLVSILSNATFQSGVGIAVSINTAATRLNATPYVLNLGMANLRIGKAYAR